MEIGNEENPMHETIARAKYAGGVRKLTEMGTGCPAYLRNKKPRKGRTAWLKWYIGMVANNPRAVVLDFAIDEGKKPTARILSLTLEPNGEWVAMEWWLKSRTFMVEGYDIPIKITKHLIERVMQREDIADIKAALSFVGPAIVHALFLWGHTEKAMTLPCRTGAVLAQRDKDNNDVIVLTSYINDQQIKHYQRDELNKMRDVAMEALKQARVAADAKAS